MAVKQVLLVMEENGDEAIYVDGFLVKTLRTFYASDIAEAVGGETIVFSHREVALPDGEDFPFSAAKLIDA